MEDASWLIPPVEGTEPAQNGAALLPPTWVAFGVRPVAMDRGEAQVALDISHRVLRNGVVPAGILGLLTDIALGAAARLTLTRPTPIVTARMSIEIAVSRLPAAGTLHAVGAPVSVRGAQILAAGEVSDATGVLIARISGWFVAVPGRAEITTPAAVALAPDVADIDGLLAFPAVTIAAPGQVRVEVMPEPHMTNPLGTLHGGVGVAIADTAACVAVESATGRGGYLPLSMSCSYLRTAGGTHRPVTVTAVVRKPGRTVSTVEAVVLTPDGRPALVVSIDANTNS